MSNLLLGTAAATHDQTHATIYEPTVWITTVECQYGPLFHHTPVGDSGLHGALGQKLPTYFPPSLIWSPFDNELLLEIAQHGGGWLIMLWREADPPSYWRRARLTDWDHGNYTQTVLMEMYAELNYYAIHKFSYLYLCGDFHTHDTLQTHYPNYKPS